MLPYICKGEAGMKTENKNQTASSRNTWDSLPMVDVSIDELDKETLDIFEKRSREKDCRYGMSPQNSVFDTIHLTQDNFPTRAAVLTFHPFPRKWISGAFIRVLYNGNTGVTEEEINGPALLQPERALEVICRKYAELDIFQKEVLRELILNAVVRKDYSSPQPVTIEITGEKDITVYNPGKLSCGITPDNLYREHLSFQRNPILAGVFSRCGMTDAWATGFHKILQYCSRSGVNPPAVQSTEKAVKAICYASASLNL